MLKKIYLILFLLFLASSAEAAIPAKNKIPAVNAKAKHALKKAASENAQTTSLSRADIKNAPPVNLTTVLRQEQSVARLTNASGDSNQTTVSIRGFGDNAAANSLILVDGFPLSNPTLLAPNLNALALEDIDDINIFQGSQGTLWGDQAVGGVLSITTRRPARFIGNINASGGSFNQKYTSAMIGNKMQNGVSIKGFILIDNTDNYREHNYQAMRSGLAQVGYDYARGNAELIVRDYHTTTFLPGGLSQAQYDANPRQATNFSNVGRYHTTLYQLLSKHAFNDKWILETRLANQAINGDGYVNQNFTRNEWDIFFNPKIIGHIHKHKLIAGYYGELSHFHMNNPMINDTVNAGQQNIYAQFTFFITKKLNFILGGREVWLNNQIKKQSNPTTEPGDRFFVSEQSLSYRPVKELRIYARRDGNFSAPKANQETWVPADINGLKPQIGVSYEAGAMWQTESQRLQLSLYQLDLHDEIAFNPTQSVSEPFGAYQNYQKTTRSGVTFSETYRPIDHVKLNTQINYVDARFDSGPFVNKHIPAVPAINLNIGAAYDITTHWQAKYYALYTGSSYPSEDNANIGRQIPGYWLNNLALQYQLPSFITSFEVNNLFNKKYSMYTVYDVDTMQNTYYPGNGRSYMLTMKASMD